MPNSKYVDDADDSVNITESIVAKYLPFWPLFVISVLLAVAGALFYLQYKTPIYESSAKILVKDEKKGLDESKILESFDFLGDKKIVENEIEVIKSVELVSKVVKNLRLYAPVSQRGTLKNGSAYLTSPVLVEAQTPDSIQEAEKIFFQYDQKTGTVSIEHHSYPVNTWFNTRFGVLRFVKNNQYEQPEKERPLFFSLVDPYLVAEDLLDLLEVESVSKQATIINLTLRDPIKKRAENILDGLIAEYKKASIEDKNTLAANTLQFVNDRLLYVLGDLDSAEKRIQAYKHANNIVDISAQGQLFLESAQKNNETIGQNSVQLAVLNQVQKYVQGEGNRLGIIPSAVGVSDPILSDLLQQLYVAQGKYESLRKSVAENNPVLLSLQQEINFVKPRILESIKTQRRSLEAGLAEINKEKNTYSALLSNLPRKERELLQISRQQDIKNSIYSFLLQKKEETALSLASTVADTRVVDKAHSTIKPVSPNIAITLLLAFAAAFMISILLVNIKEAFSRNIMFKTDIEKISSTPILGEIAYDSSRNPIVVGQGHRNYIGEQFRQLRTSLSYLSVGKHKNKFLVTSTISGEGKSFTTANLGISLSLADRRVVLLELDLRKPKLSEIFHVDRNRGVTNYLIGDLSLEDVIVPLPDHPNLSIIPSGPIPPNPSELLMTGKLREMISLLEQDYDYILIDTAPTKPVTDAYILSSLCDATLYVIRHAITPKSAIRSLDMSSRLRPLKNVAFVFNGVKLRGFGNEYGYGYGSGHTKYAYGENPAKKHS